ncbi:FAD-linked oxidase, partial [Haematococcus lacustris]
VQLGLVQEGMTIDLSLMRSVAVDPVNKVAIADGGCLLGDIDRETALHGLAVPLGHAPVTGMGLALGGGFGIATRVLGTTSDHIVGATIVTADGSVRVVDKDSDPELLWCLRGAASAMGVVTKIKFRLDDVSDAVTGTMVFPDDPEHKMWR